VEGEGVLVHLGLGLGSHDPSIPPNQDRSTSKPRDLAVDRAEFGIESGFGLITKLSTLTHEFCNILTTEAAGVNFVHVSASMLIADGR